MRTVSFCFLSVASEVEMAVATAGSHMLHMYSAFAPSQLWDVFWRLRQYRRM